MGSSGEAVSRCLKGMDITEVRTSPGSPWQNAYAERFIGSIRRECLDHVIVVNERHARRVIEYYLVYYREARCHHGLGRDSPDGRRPEPAGRGRDGQRTPSSVPEGGVRPSLGADEVVGTDRQAGQLVAKAGHRARSLARSAGAIVQKRGDRCTFWAGNARVRPVIAARQGVRRPRHRLC